MQYPMTRFKIIDQSNTPDISTAAPTIPKCLVAVACDKGYEDLKYIYGKSFYDIYGNNINFEKYGQPLLQAARIIDAGGSLLIKRVVADDSALANIGIFVKISKKSIQAVDGKGNLIYLDPDGNDTTSNEAGNAPKMVDNCQLQYFIKTSTSQKDISTINSQFQQFDTEDDTAKEYFYHLYTITDNGRGSSKKKIRISPSYADSKNVNYIKYQYQELEGDSVVESNLFTLNPDIVEINENKSLKNIISLHSNQIKCMEDDNNIYKLFQRVSEISGVDLDTVKTYDILFGKDTNKNDLNNIYVDYSDENAINFTVPYGIALESGDNGSFGDYPLNTTEYSTQLLKFFTGEFTSDIYDLDNYKPDLVIDANYPNEVKRAIESLTTWRDDLEYIEDGGIELRNINDILSVKEQVAKNRTVGFYPISYDIINPYSKKQNTVTICYSLATLLVNHFLTGRSRPMAGELYNFIIPEAIENTVNFVPRVTPAFDEKTQCVDNRINYCGFYDGVLTVETLMNTQETETQLSYINNVLAIQEIVKAVRTKCPKIRYSFITGDDLNKYEDEVNQELNKYAGNFDQIKMEYMKDPNYEENKVFYAVISVIFKNFVQNEYFELYALQNTAVIS